MDRFLPLFATPYLRPTMSEIIAAGIFGTIGITFLGLMGIVSGNALLMAPLGATAVLVFGLPDSPLSGVRHVIGGHALSMSIGLLCLFIVSSVAPASPSWLVMMGAGVGTGLAIALMLASKTVHPPAGANPMVLLFSGLSFPDATLLIALPGVFGAVLLYLVAVFMRKARPTPNH